MIKRAYRLLRFSAKRCRPALPRLLGDAVGFCLAVLIVPGMVATGQLNDVLLYALVFAVLSAAIRPALLLCSFPLLLAGTLPLMLALHALFLLALVRGVALFWPGVAVDGLGAALLGTLVILPTSLVVPLLYREITGRGWVVRRLRRLARRAGRRLHPVRKQVSAK